MDSEALLRRYDKILRIRINHSSAGFFAYLTFVLNQLRHCEENNLFPVVYFGPVSEDGPNAFHDPRHGDNTWDYYFEPVAGITFEDVRRRIQDSNDPLAPEDVVQLPSEYLWTLHAYDPESIYNYPYGHYKDVEEVDGWYELQRRRARYYLSKYIRVKEHVVAKVEAFWQKRLKGFDVVGVHMRGSDKGAADASPELMRIVPPEEYFPHLDRFLQDAPNARIFLATEQSQFVEETRARYGERVVTRDVLRTKGFGSDSNPFQSQEGDCYLKGEEVLIDCLLLARSDFLLRCTSAVGEYAMYFNENLQGTNLNDHRAERQSTGVPARPLLGEAPTAETAPRMAAEFPIGEATVIRQKAGFLVEKFDHEILLYYPDETRIVYLSETAARTWELVDGRRSAGEITRLMVAGFPGASDPSAEIRDALAQLSRMGALEVSPEGVWRSNRPVFYHDLQCLSGYGDRLLDLWAAATVARLHEPDGLLAIRWDEGLEYEGFVGTYATELFSVEGCEFVKDLPLGAIAVEKNFSHDMLNERSVIWLDSQVRQIVLRSGMMWGNSNPERLHDELHFYELDPGIAFGHVVDTYRAIARGTEPDRRVLEGIPADIEGRVGVHVRLQDKLVSAETPIEMNQTTWRSIEHEANRCIEDCINRGEPLFVCSDDASYRRALLERIRSRGGDAVSASPPPAHGQLPGYGPLVDFFALSKCTRIVQMTKFSTFSLAASLVGDVPLVNFYQDDSESGHQLDIWKRTLNQLVTRAS